jgi:archaellum component FlaC
MNRTVTLTPQDLKQIVKAVSPKFKQMSLEIGGMFAQLATKEELKQEVHRLDDRIDELTERYEQFAGSTGIFQSQVIQRFDLVDEKLKEHDAQFERIIKGGWKT